VKLVSCADQRSLDLYKIAISRVGEVWKGANLTVVPRDLIPNRPRSRAWIPDELSTPNEIMELIRNCNPSLPTHDWKVVKISEPHNELREVLIILNDESLPALEASKGVISYAFGQITLRVYKNDKSAKTPTGGAEGRVAQASGGIDSATVPSKTAGEKPESGGDMVVEPLVVEGPATLAGARERTPSINLSDDGRSTTSELGRDFERLFELLNEPLSDEDPNEVTMITCSDENPAV